MFQRVHPQPAEQLLKKALIIFLTSRICSSKKKKKSTSPLFPDLTADLQIPALFQ